MGALSRSFSYSFTAAGYPVDVKYRQYSTARINANLLQPRFILLRQAHEPHSSSRTPTFNSILKKSSPRRILVLLAIAILVGASILVLPGTGDRFSPKQVESYLKIVTSKLEQPQNLKTNSVGFGQAALSCYSAVLGQGKHKGNRGLYTWFTCSRIHNAPLANASQENFFCTGFSLPIWIAPSKKSVDYEAISTSSAYYALLNTAPRTVQNQLSSAYNLVNQRPSKQLTKNQSLC